MERPKTLFVAVLFVVVLAAGPAYAGFIKREGTGFVDSATSQPFRFGGTNNYYLHYKANSPLAPSSPLSFFPTNNFPERMVNHLFGNASAYGFNVVRVWGFTDVGNADGSNSVDGIKEGVFFHFWDGTKPAFNDGPNGLQRLDLVIARAAANDVKVIVVLTNNWKEFGGMDQYVRWRNGGGGGHHDDFYTDATIRGWYRAWVAHVLNRRNVYTGRLYKDEPAILAWELANELRCQGSGDYGTSSACHYGAGAAIITRWVAEMSAFVKSIDSNHMVAVGDEGFGCFDGNSVGWDWTMDCYAGVDSLAFGRLSSIDFLTAHLYPSSWSKSVQWADGWIQTHAQWARQVGKPVVLEEFGLTYDQVNIYAQWTGAMYEARYNGWNFWMLVTDNYPNYDGFAISCGSDACRLLAQQAQRLSALLP